MALKFLRLSWLAVLAVASGAALSAISIVDPHAIYPEGPIFRDGRLLYVEYAGPGVKTWDGKHVGVFWRGEHCGPSGLIAYRDNHLLIAWVMTPLTHSVEIDEHGNRCAPSTRTAPATRSSDRTTSHPTGAAASISRPPACMTSMLRSLERFCT